MNMRATAVCLAFLSSAACLPTPLLAQVNEPECIAHKAEGSLNSSQIEAANRCSRPVLANICARVDGRIGEIKAGQRIEPGRSFVFDVFNPDKKRMRYNLAQCEVGQSLRRDLCVPQCPAASNSQNTPKGAGQSGADRQCAATLQKFIRYDMALQEVNRSSSVAPRGKGVPDEVWCKWNRDHLSLLSSTKSKVAGFRAGTTGSCMVNVKGQMVPFSEFDNKNDQLLDSMIQMYRAVERSQC